MKTVWLGFTRRDKKTHVFPRSLLATQLVHQVVCLVDGGHLGIREDRVVKGPRVREDPCRVLADVSQVREGDGHVAVPGDGG